VRRKLLRYSLEAAMGADGAVAALQEIALDPGNARAEGLAIDPIYLYALDQIDQRLYRYRRDGTTSADVSRILRQADGGSIGAPYGVSRSGDNVFVVDASRDKVLTYGLTDIFAGTETISATAETPLDPSNDDARDVAVGD
jgi:hypothetical protein